MSVEVASTAVVEDDVVLGPDVTIWHHTLIRRGARIGAETTVGTGVYVGAGVVIGARCKIQTGARINEGTELDDGVFVGPGVEFTNDRHPRAITPDGGLKGSDDWDLAPVHVAEGASIGAGAVLVAGVELGAWCLVAAGAVVVRSVAPHELVAGVPARRLGWVCRCAARIEPPAPCPACGDDSGVDP